VVHDHFTTMPPKYKCPDKFKKEWEVEYGIQSSTVDPQTKQTTSDVCLFCKCIGRNNTTAADDDRQRKRTQRVNYYTKPFRVDNVKRHNLAQHADEWEEYKQLSHTEKKEFFIERESASAVNMRSFVQPQATTRSLILAKQKCWFMIDAAIIDEVIGGLLFDTNEEITEDEDTVVDDPVAAKKRAMSVFVIDNESEEEQRYIAKIKSALKMNLIVRFLSCGVSFRQVSKLISIENESHRQISLMS
jgi:hypothetical protein